LKRLRCGPTERFRLLWAGFSTLESLVNWHGDKLDDFHMDLVTMTKTCSRLPHVYFSEENIIRLIGAVYYFHSATQFFHVIPDTAAVTVRVADTWYRFYQHNRDLKSRNYFLVSVACMSLPDYHNWVSVKEWTDFKMSFEWQLAVTGSVRGMSLDYVVDDSTRSATSANTVRGEIEIVGIDLSQHNFSWAALFCEQTVHFGDAFELDNAMVWDMLQQRIIDKSGRCIISAFAGDKNGRGAWQALLRFYEDKDFQAQLPRPPPIPWPCNAPVCPTSTGWGRRVPTSSGVDWGKPTLPEV
jgi:hypothetical protein